MKDLFQGPWINIVAAVLGGLLLGLGIGRMTHAPSIPAGIWTVLGLILLWWALADRRRARRGTPESEADGSHTIE